MKTRIIFTAIFIGCLGLVAVRTSYLYHVPKPVGLKKEVLVMDRHTLSRSLVAIFGESSKPVVYQNLFELGGPIGGSCDYYNMVYDDQQNVVDPFTRCPAMMRDTNSAMFVKSNGLRTAALDKTCRRLTAGTEMVSHALQISHLDSAAALNLENIEKLHFVFYKAPMEEEQLHGYEKLLAEANKNVSWNQVAYSICVSPSWQVL